MRRSEIYEAIAAERVRQESLWSGSHAWGVGSCAGSMWPTIKATVLMEEVGEVARAVLEQDDRQLVTELIQVAAVAVAWLESLTMMTVAS